MYICSTNPANIKIYQAKTGIYQTMIRPVATYASETWRTLTVRDTELLRRFERMIYGPVRDPETGHYKMRSNAELA